METKAYHFNKKFRMMRVLNKGNIAGYIESVVTFTYNLQQCESFLGRILL
ncbi:hypothetical protein SAMN05421839_12335 [Halolactibacillus halophilus]|uniref:Uncharacterized protein n=1 Tax=Halolactibacillus halophilus TaxID=306540 RepID=A0A1I5QR22_9BACI|nr:hypothetical protein HHA03_14160 [Halolactibacillus halophilus]SFP48276.1 hypothetical protein SAMN05421839_12335 [Halolactibacillus halophilus]